MFKVYCMLCYNFHIGLTFQTQKLNPLFILYRDKVNGKTWLDTNSPRVPQINAITHTKTHTPTDTLSVSVASCVSAIMFVQLVNWLFGGMNKHSVQQSNSDKWHKTKFRIFVSRMMFCCTSVFASPHDKRQSVSAGSQFTVHTREIWAKKNIILERCSLEAKEQWRCNNLSRAINFCYHQHQTYH